MIVRFGAATGEDNFLWACVNERSNLFARGFDRRAGTLAKRVDGRSVAKIAGEIGKHGFEDRGVDRRGGVVIEVDALHGTGLNSG